MKRNQLILIAVLLSFAAAGCSSSKRLTIEGYSDAMLNRKRVFVVLPMHQDIRLTNVDLFAASRGFDASSAAEGAEGELRTLLVSAIQSRLDSNTVLNYSEQAVSGIVPLNATSDFTGPTPNSWSTVTMAGKEGNVDYLLVIRDVVITNTASSDERGDESIAAAYSLIDVPLEKVVTSGSVSFKVSAPRTPTMTHERMAAELTAKLPFVVGD